jgi:hypothetical protein
MRYSAHLAILGSLVIAGGCSSGGGSLPSAPSTPISITSENADDAMAASYEISSDTGSLGSEVTAVNQNSKISIRVASRIAFAHRDDALSSQVTVGATESCAQGGSVSFPDNPSSSTFTLTFSACQEEGSTIDGDMRFSFNGYDFTFMTLSGNHLKFIEGSEVIELIDYNFSFEWPSGFPDYGADYSYSFSYTVNSTVLGGQYRVETTAPFVGTEPNPPTSGSVTVTGANNSSAVLTANPDTTFTANIDADGDGIYEETQTVNWSNVIIL